VNIIEREDAGDDSELVSKAQKGSLIAQETLIKRYSWIARSKARNYFLEGGTFEDLEQEGLVGIWQAIKKFRRFAERPFQGFCRQMRRMADFRYSAFL
jgi:RNA polymerase sporulation-specific sigma factor